MQTLPTPRLYATIGYIKNTKAKKLLHILSDGGLHSGASLGETLGVTRSAVWKLINQLKEDMGVEIEAKTNQGYKISKQVELLNLRQIKAHLSQRYHPYLDKTIIFDEIPSTNSYLLEQVQNQQSDMRICLAEMQTAGRGKFNRRWFSPFGNNIYLSLLWHFMNDLPQLSGLSLVVATAIVRALKKYGFKQEIRVKWPNDLIWQERKFGGVLIDLRGEFNYNCDAVIGIGLNLYVPEALKQICEFPVADLAEIDQEIPRRNQLIGLLLEELLDALAVFQEQGLKPFIKEFMAVNHTLDKPVQIVLGKNTFHGIGRGIDEKGYFLLEDKQGKIQRFSCGEASLRG